MSAASHSQVRLATTAILATAITGLAGCSSSGGGGAGPAGGGTLTIQGDTGNPSLVEDFNPFHTSTELHGSYLIYEPMAIPSPVNGSYTQFLATGYKVKDPTTLVYSIRQGVKWSDGKDLTPADVVFTFNLLKKNPSLDGNSVWGAMSDISASGNDVTITLKAPNVPFAATIAQVPIVPEHLWSISDPAKYANTKPVGTGPFTLDKFAPTQYTLKKNPSYWNASAVAPSQVVFPAQATSQSTNQLDVTSGQFDWAYNYLPNVQQTYIARNPTHNQYWFPPGGTIALYLNLTKAPYSDVNFRKGLSLSLDRTTIAKKAVNGYLDQASMSGLILPNLKRWLDPSLPNQGLVSQDRSAAQAAFSKAGYSSQGGKLVGPNGTPATMTIVLPASFSDWVAAATEVQTELAAAGIAVSLETPQFAQYADATQGGSFDAAIGGFGGTGNPYTDFNQALNSSFATPVKTTTTNNFERFKDPAADQALVSLASATSDSAQADATHKLEKIVYDQVPAVLMYYGGSWGLFSTKNFTGWPSASDPYTLPTPYNNAILTVLMHLKKA